eukprot:789847-Rhodomonas_salina.1
MSAADIGQRHASNMPVQGVDGTGDDGAERVAVVRRHVLAVHLVRQHHVPRQLVMSSAVSRSRRPGSEGHVRTGKGAQSAVGARDGERVCEKREGGAAEAYRKGLVHGHGGEHLIDGDELEWNTALSESPPDRPHQ